MGADRSSSGSESRRLLCFEWSLSCRSSRRRACYCWIIVYPLYARLHGFGDLLLLLSVVYIVTTDFIAAPTMLRLLLSSLVLSCLCLLASAKPSILLFTATAKGAYRHDAIPYAVKVITALGKSTAASRYIDPSVQSVTWKTTNTEDASLFEDLTYLRKFDAIVFAFTTDVDPPGVGTILSNKGATNLFQYIQDGGNFAGIHSATNTLFAYPAYGRLAGAFFTYHAGSQHVRLKSLSSSHPAVSKIDSPYWSITDEMYHMRSDPRLLPSVSRAPQHW